MKQYVLLVVTNEIGSDHPEYDERIYYRCDALDQESAYAQTKYNIPNVILCEVVGVSY